MRRLVWAFADRTYRVVGNLMSQFIWSNPLDVKTESTIQEKRTKSGEWVSRPNISEKAFENVVCLKSSAVYFTNIFDECQYRGNQCGSTLFDQEASKSF